MLNNVNVGKIVNVRGGAERSELAKLAVRYFRRKGYKVKEGVILEGYCGAKRSFELIVQKGDSTHCVWVKDWKRTIGVNVVINLDRASEDVGFTNPIIVGENFSDHAKYYANRRKITLLTRSQMLQELGR